MHWTESTTYDDFQVTPEITFRDAGGVGQAINQAMCAICQVLPVSRIAHKIQSGIARPKGHTR